MSGELLRRAAALMRERAEAVDTTPSVFGDDVAYTWAEQIGYIVTEPDASHLTTFGHPAVALAVADWLDAVGKHMAAGRAKANPKALAVARAYLGEAGDD